MTDRGQTASFEGRNQTGKVALRSVRIPGGSLGAILGSQFSARNLMPRNIFGLIKQLTSSAGWTIAAAHRCRYAYRSRTTSLVVPSGCGSI